MSNCTARNAGQATYHRGGYSTARASARLVSVTRMLPLTCTPVSPAGTVTVHVTVPTTTAAALAGTTTRLLPLTSPGAVTLQKTPRGSGSVWPSRL